MNKPRTPSRAAQHIVTPRTVYLCTVGSNSAVVEATTVSDLAKRLAPHLGLEPYSVQAIARIAHIERATITTPTWTIRRLGMLQFMADDDAAPLIPKAANLHNTEVPAPTALPGGVSSLPSWMEDSDADH